MKKRYIILILIFLLFIAGCSSNNQTPNQGNSELSGLKVEITGFAFSPQELTIKTGETVTWINKDSVKHTITSDSGSELSSEMLSNSQTYSHIFNTKGAFNYHCSLHSSMTAKIIVE